MESFRIFVDFPLDEPARDALRAGASGHELIFPAVPAASVLQKAEADPRFSEADVAFGQPDPNAVASSERLRWIQLSTSGFARYDNPEFRELVSERRIPVSNSASVYADACAAHVFAFMLAQARRLPSALKILAASGDAAWKDLRNRCSTLEGEAVLILGYGAIGARLAELLRPFRARVQAYRRRPRGNEAVPVILDADAALAEADHVVNILPDSAETRGFFGEERFARMKRDAVYYNIGRGTTTDQEALLNALASGRLRAAWLDVTDPEPLPADHPLRAQENCHVTPHVAGGHANESLTLVRHFLRNLRLFEREEPLLDRIM